MSFTPYWYQQDAIDAAVSAFCSELSRILIVAPTGSGKSVIIACFCEQAIRAWGIKILAISSFEEILKQDFAAIERQLPGLGIGLYSAGLGRKTLGWVTVAGIQSIYRKPQLFEDFDLIIIDEAHLVSFSPGSMYRKFLDALGKPTLGLTATDFRMKGGYLWKGEAAYFEAVAYRITIPVLQREGRLCQVISQGSKIKLNADDIRVQGGDYVAKELSKEFDREAITRDIAVDLSQYVDSRKLWLGFGIDIEHCENLAAALRMQGVNAEAYHSKLKDRFQKALMRDYRKRKKQSLVSVGKLTTGFDIPPIDLIFMARPTRSPGLYIQMVGRGMRVADGKKDLLVCDYAMNYKNGPIDDPRVPEPGKKKKKGDPILKECEECFLITAVAVRECPRCGWEFPIRHHLIGSPSKKTIVSKGEWHLVDNIRYSVQLSRKDGTPMLKVEYQCGLRFFSEFVLLNHSGYALAKAHRWWELRFTEGQWIPSDSEEALEYSNYLKKPSEIYVDERGKYPQINDYMFKE